MTIVRAFRPVIWFARRVGLAPSPLRRPVDRVESLLLLGAVLLALAGVPFTMAVGQAAYHGGLHIAAAETASRIQVTATLVQNAPGAGAVPDTVVTSPALAVWTLPDGSVRSGRIGAVPGSPAGSDMPVWVDAQGRPTSTPLTTDQAMGRGIITGFLTELAVVAVLAGLLSLLRWRLNKRRWADWDTEWRTIGPQWTKYRI